MKILSAATEHLRTWAEMRFALWSWDNVDDHANQAEQLYLAGDPDRVAFVAVEKDGNVAGFAEATLRRDYVEGCDTSPVAFLEGVFVRPEWRRTGVARALSDRVEAWGKANGCTEYASNALIENEDSHAFHKALGFVETERVVFFKRELP